MHSLDHSQKAPQPTSAGRTAPIRDDWAYEAAAKLYALALACPQPTACIDLIAHDLRIAYLRGGEAALKEALADMERRP